MRTKNRITVLLLAAAALVCLWAAPALARRENTAKWQGTWDLSERASVSSNVLLAQGQDVVLQTVAGQKTLEITLQCESGMVSGQLSAEENPYLTANFDRTQLSLRPGETQTVNLTLTTTEACGALTEAVVQRIRVLWIPASDKNDTLWADILVPLTPAEPTQPAEPETTQQTEPEATQPTEPETTQPTEPENAPSESAAEQQTRTDGETAQADVQLSDTLLSCSAVCSKEIPVALEICAQEGRRNLIIDCYTEDFPAMTRYVIDGRSVLLYDGGKISLETAEAVTVFLYLSDTKLLTDGSFVVQALAELEGLTQYQRVLISISTQSPVQWPGQTMLLTRNETLRIPVSYTCQTAVSCLSTGESGELVWKPVAGAGFQTVMDEEQKILSVSLNPTELPPAGTYRLELSWYYGDTVVCTKDAVFYVQYDSAILSGAGS